MKSTGLVLTTIVSACLGALFEGCAAHGGRAAAPSEQEASRRASQEEVTRPGQDGTIVLKGPTWLADLQLKAGRFEFQQRVDSGERVLQVTEVKRYAQFKRRPTESKRFVADVRCRLEALGETAGETAVHLRSEAGIMRVEWITFGGEHGRYFPEAIRR